MSKYTGWLLDLYPAASTGIALWFLLENGARQRFMQPFAVTFHAFAPQPQLRMLWNYLQKQPIPVKLAYTQKTELFEDKPITVLSITAPDPYSQDKLFRRLSFKFPEITYYDADLHIALRHAALFGTFPLCRCEFTLDNNTGQIIQITSLDSPWNLQSIRPPLRIMQIEPDEDPRHSQPGALKISTEKDTHLLSLRYPRPLMLNLKALLQRYDPDLLLTAWGDRWLLPYLLELTENLNIRLPLNRDSECELSWRPERSYFSYGQVIHRDQQIHLAGRWHIDIHNAMLYHDYKMEGIYELSRVTSLPLQTTARVSPGSGISAMQMVTALRQDILVPWHKQQVEAPKTAWELLLSDQGGLVYQPVTGLHRHVAELDFISMYPSIMVHYNISPETIRGPVNLNERLAAPPDKPPGLIPQTLKPLLDKRMAIKHRLLTLQASDPGYESLKAKASAHKWLLVTCFGYLGYKNARFGRIEAHEAVTAYGREALLRAKEAAEDLGFSVLHLYVDGMWVQQENADKVSDYEALLREIASRTGLPISLEGIYNWIAFLPSRQDARIPVANRYFGAYQDSSLKVRGIELRRRDTPLWIAEKQQAILQQLARIKDPESEMMSNTLSKIKNDVRKSIAGLTMGHIAPEKLIITQKLSRTLEEYRSSSPAARAASQLAEIGKVLRPGQMVRFIYMLGSPGVQAWDLPQPIQLDKIDIDRYARLMLRAVNTILMPFTGEKFSLNINSGNPSVSFPICTTGGLPLLKLMKSNLISQKIAAPKNELNLLPAFYPENKDLQQV